MDDRSSQVLAIAILFLTLSWIVVGLRVYVRAFMIKSWGLDDWIMIGALSCFTFYLICQLGGVYYGTGRYDAELEPENIMKGLRFWYLCESFYVISSTVLKVAIGLFLLRIAVNKMHIFIIYFINIASVVFGTAYLAVVMFQCNPIHTFWTIKPNNEHCLPRDTVANITYAASALASFADWTFGTLPAFIVWDLQMNQRTKLIVVGILGFAAIGSTATLVRIPYIKGLKAVDNFLYTSTDVAIWSTVEIGVGMIAACVATLRPLLQRILANTGLSSHSRTRASNLTPNWGFSGHRLASNAGDNMNVGVTTTTVIGRSDKKWHEDSDGNSDEYALTSLSHSGMQISKSVEVTHVHEEASVSDYKSRNQWDSNV